MANPFFKDLMPIMRVVPLQDGLTCMVRSSMESDNPAKRGRWGWPGGQIDLLPGATGFAETALQALIRECRDESGMQIKDCGPPALVESRKILDGKHAGKIAMTYVCIASRLDFMTDKIDIENDQVGWFSLEQLATMPIANLTPVTSVIRKRLPDLCEFPAQLRVSAGLLE